MLRSEPNISVALIKCALTFVLLECFGTVPDWSTSSRRSWALSNGRISMYQNVWYQFSFAYFEYGNLAHSYVSRAYEQTGEENWKAGGDTAHNNLTHFALSMRLYALCYGIHSAIAPSIMSLSISCKQNETMKYDPRCYPSSSTRRRQAVAICQCAIFWQFAIQKYWQKANADWRNSWESRAVGTEQNIEKEEENGIEQFFFVMLFTCRFTRWQCWRTFLHILAR